MGAAFEFVEIVDAVFRFRAACLGLAAHPVEFGAQQVFHAGEFGAEVLFPFGAAPQVIVVIAVVGEKLLPVDLDDAVADLVEEIAVVGDHQQGDALAAEVILEPFDHLDVEVVGGLVEDEHVGFGEEHAGEGHAFCLAAGEVFDRHVGILDIEEGKHLAGEVGAVVFLVVLMERGGGGIFEGRHARGHRGKLLQIADAQAVAVDHAAGIVILVAGQDVEERRLAVAVAGHDSDFVAFIYAKRDVGEKEAVAERFRQLFNLQIAYHNNTKFFRH